MSELIYSFIVTVPAGTAEDAGWSQALTFPSATVDSIEIRVPPGPRGNMGFAVGSDGVSVIPYNTGEWIVTDDEIITWSLTDLPDAGNWEMLAYNTGKFDHDIYIRFVTTPTAGASTTSSVPDVIPTASLSG